MLLLEEMDPRTITILSVPVNLRWAKLTVGSEGDAYFLPRVEVVQKAVSWFQFHTYFGVVQPLLVLFLANVVCNLRRMVISKGGCIRDGLILMLPHPSLVLQVEVVPISANGTDRHPKTRNGPWIIVVYGMFYDR